MRRNRTGIRIRRSKDDTSLFLYFETGLGQKSLIAFYLGRHIQDSQGEPWTLHQIAVTGTGNYIYKFAMAILLTPLIYLLHSWIEKYLGHDIATKMKRAAMNKKDVPETNIPAAG